MSFEIGLPRYNKDLVNQMIIGLSNKRDLSKNHTASAISVLDFGAGLGTLADLFHEKCSIKPDCVEIDKELVTILQQKHYATFNSIKSVVKKYDWIYCSNVLEHIDNDLECLQDMYSALNTGGMLAIYVPASQILFSDFDTSVGHFRRYSKSEIESKVSKAGFKVVSCRFNDSLGFLFALSAKVMGKRGSRLVDSAAILYIYDRVIYPLSRKIDALGFRYVVGKNLLLIAEKRTINE